MKAYDGPSIYQALNVLQTNTRDKQTPVNKYEKDNKKFCLTDNIFSLCPLLPSLKFIIVLMVCE